MLRFTAIALLCALASAGPSFVRRQAGVSCLLDPTVTAAVTCTLNCLGGQPTALVSCETTCIQGLSSDAQTCVQQILGSLPGVPGS